MEDLEQMTAGWRWIIICLVMTVIIFLSMVLI
jgi:hypothetical protein